MKTAKTFLASLFILLSITSISAQYGNNGYGNGYGNSYGGGMNQMGGMNQNSQPEKPKEIPVEVTVAKFMEDLKPALNLDELQNIAISNILIESINSQGRVLKLNLSPEDQLKEFQSLSENTDRKINEFLNDDQKQKYLAFKEEKKKPKKSKDKSKGRKKS